MKKKLKKYIETYFKACINLYKEHKYETAKEFVMSLSERKINSIFKKYECEIFNLYPYFEYDIDMSDFKKIIDVKKWMLTEAIEAIILNCIIDDYQISY